MRIVLQIALGIIAAIGGFVDIGDLVFNTQAGALFGYDLLWAVPLGVIGIGLYAEMCGRVAAVSKRPVFDVIRMRMGLGIGLLTLIASLFVNLLTLAAEIGGVALVLELFFDAPFTLFVLLGTLGLIAIIWFVPFEGLERIFGYLGLTLFVFLAAALHEHPDWGAVGHGFVPDAKSSTLYWYFAVGVFAAALMPYEVYFYSSGALEEGWSEKDLKVNRLNAIVGYGIGGLLSVALMVAAAQIFQPAGVSPDHLASVPLLAQIPYGETGLVLALIGILFAIGGASIDASFAAAYSVAQFAGWEWGKYRRASGAPRFTLLWLMFFGLGVLVLLTGIDPLDITEYSVVLSVVALPLTYLPIMLVARDRAFMGEYANGVVTSALGWVYFGLICVVAIVAIPLLLATNAGGG
jgi:Mn2+/Fe2+ NRAMP family transporter